MKYNLFDQTIGEYFKEKRMANRYSVRYVAERIDATKSTYFYYEKGDVSIPIDKVKKLLALYNEDGDELLDRLQSACSRYLIDLYAQLHGYEVQVSFSSRGDDDAGL